MKTLAEKFTPTQRFVFWQMDWNGYQQILTALGSKRLRHTYHNGVLEIMSPSRNHEYYKSFLARIIETMTFELKIPIQSLGSLTMSPDEVQGIEPDECYFISQHLDCSENERWNPQHDPAPDLAIEIEVTNSIKSRLPIFAKLKIPEIWLYNGQELKFLHLNSADHYSIVSQSIAFPFIHAEDLMPFLELLGEQDENMILHQFINWLRSQPNTNQ